MLCVLVGEAKLDWGREIISPNTSYTTTLHGYNFKCCNWQDGAYNVSVSSCANKNIFPSKMKPAELPW